MTQDGPTTSWREYEPWRTGLIPATQESRYSQYLVAILMFGTAAVAVGWVVLSGVPTNYPRTLLSLCGVLFGITLVCAVAFFGARGPVHAVLNLAHVPTAPGDRLKGEVTFDRETKPDSPLDLELRAFAIKYLYNGPLPGRKLQPVGPTHQALRTPGESTFIRALYGQKKQIAPDELRQTQSGFLCPVEFDIPQSAPEASIDRATEITVWTLTCESKTFQFPLWFGHLPVFRS
jgi:hypothetical protein